MTDLGGYFGFEGFPEGDGMEPGPGIHFASGRQALIPWLIARGVGRLHLPGWICPAVLDAAEAAGAQPVGHHLGPDLHPASLPEPQPGDALLLLNPFGLFHGDPDLDSWQGHPVIMDDTMAFFRGPREACPSFNSWRKFLPVPDGATLHDPGLQQPNLRPLTGDDGFLKLREERGATAGRDAFLVHEATVGFWPPAAPSAITAAIMGRLDGAAIRRRRRENYAVLHAALASANTLDLPALHTDAVPMAYPFLPAGGDRHEALWERAVWAPRLWGEDGRLQPSDREQRLARALLPLPVDHRYGAEDMERLLSLVGDVVG